MVGMCQGLSAAMEWSLCPHGGPAVNISITEHPMLHVSASTPYPPRPPPARRQGAPPVGGACQLSLIGLAHATECGQRGGNPEIPNRGAKPIPRDCVGNPKRRNPEIPKSRNPESAGLVLNGFNRHDGL